MPFALKFHSGSFLFNPARYLRYPLRSDGVKTVDRLPRSLGMTTAHRSSPASVATLDIY
jgi:hypothetical protein